jgi:PAS domain S-box-containing protein
VESLRVRLQEAEDTLEALRLGEADAIVVRGPDGPRVYTLVTPDESYRMLVEQMSEGALILSHEGRIVYANRRLCELVGDNAPATRLLSDLAIPEDRAQVEELLRAAAVADAACEVRFSSGPPGEGVPVQLSISGLRTGAFTGLVAVVTDLTDTKRREQAADRQRLTSAVLDFAGTAILVCDAEGLVVRANREAIALGCEEPIGRPFEEVLPIGVTHEILRESTASEPLEVTLHRPGRDDRFLLVSSRRIDEGTPADGWWVVTLVDVTDRRHAEEELRRAMEVAEAARYAHAQIRLVRSELVASS